MINYEKLNSLDWLRYNYIDLKRSTINISNECDCSPAGNKFILAGSKLKVKKITKSLMEKKWPF